MLSMLNLNKYIPAFRAEARHDERYPTALTVTLSSPLIGTFKAALVDLSANGARLRAPVKLLLNTPILLEIEGMPLLSARVVWYHSHEVGICFDHRLHPAVLDYLLAKIGTDHA